MSSLISKRNHKKMRDISATCNLCKSIQYTFVLTCYIVLFITGLVDYPSINTWIVNNVLSIIINLCPGRPLCYLISIVKNVRWSDAMPMML